jgi:hypothetical protein
VEQPLERSLVMREKALQSGRQQAQFTGAASKRKLTNRLNNKPNNKDKPSNSKRSILFGGHSQPV